MSNRGFKILEEFEEVATMPVRKTRHSAGYDIAAANYAKINPGEMKILKTGITSYMKEDEVLKLFIRSGLAKEHRLALQNQTGIIDSDFYGKHIRLLIKNEGQETFKVKPGDRIVQGIFQKYLTVDNEEYVTEERKGGLGSTGVSY